MRGKNHTGVMIGGAMAAIAASFLTLNHGPMVGIPVGAVIGALVGVFVSFFDRGGG